MTRLSDEVLEPLLPDVCVALGCHKSPATEDMLGLSWCAACEHRREFLAWGLAHNYPELSIGSYALAAGRAMWCTTAMIGDDDRVYALLFLTQALDEEEAA